MSTIRSLFSTRRPIDRPIEKVIDYYADAAERLAAEIEEYEITDNLEGCFQRFLDSYGEGVRGGQVAETGIWVSGFYGSGKSSFTKYLGFALDADRKVDGRPFLDLVCDRFQSPPTSAELRTVATKYPAKVIVLDLATEQSVESTTTAVDKILYWKVLEWAGYSKVGDIADLELLLEDQGKMDEFRAKHAERHGGRWEDIHSDPLIAKPRASQLAHELLPQYFETPDTFRTTKYQLAQDARDLARRMIDIVRKKSGRENVVFLVDEAGQYVASSSSLILNLDGLARNLKELGKGKVWIVATGQQTLTEIVERAAYNSEELFKLRDRFPIAINIDARDIKEITYRRLLQKSQEGVSTLKQLFAEHGQAMIANSRLTGTSLYSDDLDAEKFARFYPFLPQHFDLLLELIRVLASRGGTGIGLRSAIRVMQDVLADPGDYLPRGVPKLADRPVGALASVDYFYDVLREDIRRSFAHVVAGVDRVEQVFAGNELAIRAAKAVAALQPLEALPKTPENIAALLYSRVGDGSLVSDLREALAAVQAHKECSLVDDPQSGGFVFLSEGVRSIRQKRNDHVPTSGDCNRIRKSVLVERVFQNKPPTARIEGNKEVRASVITGGEIVLGDRNDDLQFRLELVDPGIWESTREECLVKTSGQSDLARSVVWLARRDSRAEDLLAEVARSGFILREYRPDTADQDQAQYLRSEERSVDTNQDAIATALAQSLLDGVFVFRGRPIPARERGETVDSAAGSILAEAAKDVFKQIRLMPIRPPTDLAPKFLEVERIDRMPQELDPMGFVVKTGTSPRIDGEHATLQEMLRVISEKSSESGAGRLQGKFILDSFAGPPYGWTKDATRYGLAALLRDGKIQLYAPAGVVKTAGSDAADALRSNQSFNSIGVAIRDTQIPPEALDQAARRLEELLGTTVLPLEDRIGEAVRQHFPAVLEEIGALPDQLRLLGLAGEGRASGLKSDVAELLKEDAGGAASILGAVDCSIPADVRWARDAAKALGAEGEKAIRGIVNLKQAVSSLGQDYPTEVEGLINEQDAEALADFFASEAFHQNLPEIRQVVNRITSSMDPRVVQIGAAFTEERQNALDSLEAMPAWARLADEDRQQIARELLALSVPEAEPGQPWVRLRTLISRRNALPRLAERLREEVIRRMPPPEDVSEGAAELEDVSVAELASDETLLRSEGEVNAWLDSVRVRLLGILRSRKHIRLRAAK